MEIDHFVDVQIQLKTGSVALPVFDAELFMLDSEAVPIDRRIRVLTKDDIDDLTVDSVERNYATAYFGQEIKPDEMLLGRLVKTALPPMFICGDHDTDLANWQAITAGVIVVRDSGTGEDYVTGLDFSSITALSQVRDVIQTALQALVSPTVVGLDSATFIEDALGRWCLRMPDGQDETDPTVYIGFNATPGTVPYLLGLQELGAGTIVTGYAVETLLESYDAIKVKSTAFYDVTIEDRLTGPTYTEETALAAQIETERRQCTFVDTNSDAVDPADATDLQSVLALLDYDNASVIYTEHDDYPDACSLGAWLPAREGTKSWGHTPLSGCLPSGSQNDHYDLSSSDRSALETKGANYIVYAGGFTFLHRGKTCGGKEKRMVLGKHWMEAGMQADVFNLDMNEDLLSFDEFTVGTIEGIIKKWLDEALKRRIITDYEINMPDVSEFTALEKSSGDMVLSEVFTATGNFEAHTFQITGSITL